MAALLLILATSACSSEKQTHTETSNPSAGEIVSLTMYKNPNCQCCTRWATYMEESGYSVKEIPTDTLASLKKQKGVPNRLSSCHTAIVGGYVVEGHVPVEAVNKLLKEQPKAKGIVVPGMPAQSPGMAENPGPVKVYFFNGPDKIAYFDKF